jgi:hypothetical protein
MWWMLACAVTPAEPVEGGLLVWHQVEAEVVTEWIDHSGVKRGEARGAWLASEATVGRFLGRYDELPNEQFWCRLSGCWAPLGGPVTLLGEGGGPLEVVAEKMRWPTSASALTEGRGQPWMKMPDERRLAASKPGQIVFELDQSWTRFTAIDSHQKAFEALDPDRGVVVPLAGFSAMWKSGSWMVGLSGEPALVLSAGPNCGEVRARRAPPGEFGDVPVSERVADLAPLYETAPKVVCDELPAEVSHWGYTRVPDDPAVIAALKAAWGLGG